MQKPVYSVYVLKSESYGVRYVGCTQDVQVRLKQHNDGRCRFTKSRRPWELVYHEEFDTLSKARKREFSLKSGRGRKELDRLLKW